MTAASLTSGLQMDFAAPVMQVDDLNELNVTEVAYWLGSEQMVPRWSPSSHELFPSEFQEQVHAMFVAWWQHSGEIAALPFELVEWIVVLLQPEALFS